MSMTATGGPWSSRPWAGSSAASRRRLASIKPTDEAARRRIFERFATTRKARIGHEIFVGIEGLLPFRGFYAIRGAVGQEFPALLIILEIGHHNLLEHLLVHGRVEDRAKHLDPAVEIARHHVGGGDVDRGLGVREAVAGAEAVDASMLEKAPEDRLDPNVLRQARQAPPQAADAA